MSEDVKPRTLPAGTIRSAFNGEEWLVLIDLTQNAPAHSCEGGGLPWTQTAKYEVFFTDEFQPCNRRKGCGAIISGAYHGSREFNDLDSATADFESQERELIEVPA